MATSKKVKNDLLPLRAGCARLTPVDSSGKLLRDKAYTTPPAYVSSVSVSTARNSETVSNGNGQDGEFPVDEVRSMTVSMNVYDPKFNAFLNGMKEVTVEPEPYLTTVTPTKKSSGGDNTLEYEFKDVSTQPVPNTEDEKTHFDIRNAFGKKITEVSSSSELGSATESYSYESASHKLSFSKDLDGQSLSCNYYIAGDTDGEAYVADPVLKTKIFMIEVFGKMMSASSGETVRITRRLTRAAVSGDLPGATTQKQKSNTLTYNFKTMPVPEGISPYYESEATEKETV